MVEDFEGEGEGEQKIDGSGDNVDGHCANVSTAPPPPTTLQTVWGACELFH